MIFYIGKLPFWKCCLAVKGAMRLRQMHYKRGLFMLDPSRARAFRSAPLFVGPDFVVFRAGIHAKSHAHALLSILK